MDCKCQKTEAECSCKQSAARHCSRFATVCCQVLHSSKDQIDCGGSCEVQWHCSCEVQQHNAGAEHCDLDSIGLDNIVTEGHCCHGKNLQLMAVTDKTNRSFNCLLPLLSCHILTWGRITRLPLVLDQSIGSCCFQI